MKGLELCHKYFNAYGEQMINKKFYSYRNKIAVGMVGEGSECLGFDDPISRDHDWGPGFCLWLGDADFDEIGSRLQEAYEQLPRIFMGFVRKPAALSNQKNGVFRISDFYKRFTGLAHAPENNMQWVNLSDEYLCACTSGKVFFDPLGQFSDIRNKLLNFYPEDVRLFKIAAKCMTCAQSGQYNFMRSVKRGEVFAAAYALNTFCSDIISLVFLLNKKFVPFYKWKHRAVRELSILGESIYENITQLLFVNDEIKKNKIIENSCAQIINEIKNQGMSESKSDFLLEHGIEVQKRIQDIKLRERDAWGG
ncbi:MULTISPECIES: DUF4037 domain-containing protein [Desulfobacula]|uniref:Conserved uncharacterized protein associated with anaerobic toluene degradation gene cluster n=2 Tax=Desulfobacula TaxID=28222 RepID=K0NCT2_DESTT|nr:MULTISPECIES: DUF4037 domain-containing protein [Desulfobacula]CCK78671.1 conserved uncharacterized protein associated with anaerobic toluene degradation gene cluster [Desulfobacula toluolica Tol2]SDT88311.1 protein of unknown function [Desulfobacula phenolica]